jgi:hypothetical protein
MKVEFVLGVIIQNMNQNTISERRFAGFKNNNSRICLDVFYVESKWRLHLLSTYMGFITSKRIVLLKDNIWANWTENSSFEYSGKPWE